MFKLTFVSAVVIVCLAGCAGQQGASSPTTEPTGAEPESAEPEAGESELGESEWNESEMDESESSEVEPAEPEAAEPEAESPAKPKPAAKSCAELPQKTCEITQGCAWSTDKKCVEQGR
jgi:hypothetical protein